MTQHSAEISKQFPNLFELIGRQSGWQGSGMWQGPVIGSDELSDGIEPSPAHIENFLQDEIRSPSELSVASICNDENFLQDEIVNSPANAVSLCDDETIGQDEIGSPSELVMMSLCDDETIGQDEIGSPSDLVMASICSDENLLQDEIASDSRLKTDIAQVGSTVYGLPLYNFRYIGRAEVYEGVMAQDVLKVMPSAVSRGSDGYYRVKYKQLGVQMRRVA